MANDKKKLGQWAYEYDLRLLDEELYQDTKLYTQKEFENMVPRNVCVPLHRNDLKKGDTIFKNSTKVIKAIDDKMDGMDSFKEKKEVEKVEGELVEEVELNINFEVTKQVKPLIEFGYKEIKKELEKALVKYKKLEVTEENLSEMKTKKSELSSLRTKINDFKVNMKKLLKAPIDTAEDQLKELIGMIKEVEAPIKAGLEVFVEKEREEKRVKVLGFIKEAYEKYGIDKEYQTIEVTDRHLLKSQTQKATKEDIDTKALVLLEQQNEVVRLANEAKNQKETDIAFIKQQVKQAEDIHKVKLNEKTYLNKFENGVTVRQIGIDISNECQTILNNNAIAAEQATKEATAKAKENFDKAKAVYESDVKEEVEIPGIIKNPQTHDPDTGEVFEDKVEVETPNPKFLFTFTVTGIYEELEALNKYFEEKNLDFESLGFVEVE